MRKQDFYEISIDIQSPSFLYSWLLSMARLTDLN
jgi:hypothetical protein